MPKRQEANVSQQRKRAKPRSRGCHIRKQNSRQDYELSRVLAWWGKKQQGEYILLEQLWLALHQNLAERALFFDRKSKRHPSLRVFQDVRFYWKGLVRQRRQGLERDVQYVEISKTVNGWIELIKRIIAREDSCQWIYGLFLEICMKFWRRLFCKDLVNLHSRHDRTVGYNETRENGKRIRKRWFKSVSDGDVFKKGIVFLGQHSPKTFEDLLHMCWTLPSVIRARTWE